MPNDRELGIAACNATRKAVSIGAHHLSLSSPGGGDDKNQFLFAIDAVVTF